MDPNGHIYQDKAELIPLEDKARLEGFLRGRAEADEDKIEAIEDRLERLLVEKRSRPPR